MLCALERDKLIKYLALQREFHIKFTRFVSRDAHHALRASNVQRTRACYGLCCFESGSGCFEHVALNCCFETEKNHDCEHIVVASKDDL